MPIASFGKLSIDYTNCFCYNVIVPVIDNGNDNGEENVSKGHAGNNQRGRVCGGRIHADGFKGY